MPHTILPSDDFIATTRPVVEEALAECERVLPSYKEMRIITQYTENSLVIEKMGGSSGRAGDDTLIEISVNTSVGSWRESLKGSVAHEYNHVVWHQIHGKDWQTVTLGELIAMEGLAQNFEKHFAGEPPVFATYVNKEKLRNVWDQVENHLEENGDQWWQRLSFEDGDEFPLWSGYSLAYSVVSKQVVELDLPWPELMKVDAGKLIENGFKV